MAAFFLTLVLGLDRGLDRYYFPPESAERRGEIDDETGHFFLIDGKVEAEADEIEVDGTRLPVWSVGFDSSS